LPAPEAALATESNRPIRTKWNFAVVGHERPPIYS
jgi:hypothetical protein